MLELCCTHSARDGIHNIRPFLMKNAIIDSAHISIHLQGTVGLPMNFFEVNPRSSMVPHAVDIAFTG
jgi:hypothetical protein